MARTQQIDFGNAALSENQLIDKTLFIFLNQKGRASFIYILSELFPNTQGTELKQTLERILKILKDDGLIQVEIDSNARSISPISYYSITGKGIRFCTRPWVFKKRPYLFAKLVNVFEAVITKYMPLIISLIALVVAILAYENDAHKH